MNKYPIRKSIRLNNYDYSNNGWYFVTICSYNRKNIFGEYKNDVGANGCWPANDNIKINLNNIGLIVGQELKNTGNIRHEIKLDQYVIMPNHIHCIIMIQRNLTGEQIISGGQPSAPTYNVNRKQTLSSFVSGFKSAVTKRINILRDTPRKPVWQRSFYDHIIRDEKSLHNIREYIVNNPKTWDNDDYNPNKKSHNNSLQLTGEHAH